MIRITFRLVGPGEMFGPTIAASSLPALGESVKINGKSYKVMLRDWETNTSFGPKLACTLWVGE